VVDFKKKLAKGRTANVALIRDVAALLRSRPESYDPTTLTGGPWGDSREPNYDLIGHVLEVLLCYRRSCPTTGVVTWWDIEQNLKVMLPNKLAYRKLGLPESVTRDWYLDTWKPPAQYGEGAVAVADYLDALADEFEFYENVFCRKCGGVGRVDCCENASCGKCSGLFTAWCDRCPSGKSQIALDIAESTQ